MTENFLSLKVVTLKKKDWISGAFIGLTVGILIQPIFGNLFPNLLFTPMQRASIVFFFVCLPWILLMVAGWIGELWATIFQFAKFAAVGAASAFVDLGVLSLEITMSGEPRGIMYSLFKAVSFVAATTNSFLWNRYWTFRAKGKMSSNETTRYYGVAIVGWVLNVTAASILVNGIHRPVIISENLWAILGGLVGTAAAAFWDFNGYKIFVFKEKNNSSSEISVNGS